MSSKPSLMRIVAAFAAAVLTIAAVTTASLRSLSARRDGSRWVVHTQDVQLAIARVLALATEAETRQRGYLLTGREEDAETFRAAQSALSQEVDVLALLTQDNPRQQQRRREEEASDRARVLEYQERLIAIAGHDLRNPLTAVLVSAQMLLQKREELKPGQANAVERILRSASRIDALAALLIDFTYARLGKGIPMRPGPMDARAVVERTVDELRATHPAREIRLEVNAPAMPDSWDGDRISQVVSNLVANAVQYGAADAPVTVSLNRDAADALEIRVHNQGAPLPPELRQRLFEPYERGKGAESAHPRGLGLGLFIVREIARAHGGSIDVGSDAKGTTFVVHLPRRAPGMPGGDTATAQRRTAGVPAG